MLGSLPLDFRVLTCTKAFLELVETAVRKLTQLKLALKEAVQRKTGAGSEDERVRCRAVVSALRKKVTAQQHKFVIAGAELIPNSTTLLHCLLQRGVQSPVIREAAAAAMSNAKSMETDSVPLKHSSRMAKATTTNVLILVAPGFEAQPAWTAMPLPYTTFADMLTDAGGELHRIMHSNLSPAEQADPAKAEAEWKLQLQQAVNDRDTKNKTLWNKLCDITSRHGFAFNRDRPFFGKSLRASAAVDRSADNAIQAILRQFLTGQLARAGSWAHCAHKTEWFFPWSNGRPNPFDPLLLLAPDDLLGGGAGGVY
eukprot:3472372-Rhodomonas_salina.1